MKLSSVLLSLIYLLCHNLVHYTSLFVSGQQQNDQVPFGRFGEHQVALTGDMVNVLLNVLSLECKDELESTLRTNGKTAMSESCKLELRRELLEANAIPEHFRNGNIMGIGASKDGSIEIPGNGRSSHKNRNRSSKMNSNDPQSNNSFYSNPILQFIFHPVALIVFFVVILLVVAIYAIIYINSEMKKKGIKLYSKPKKLSKKKEEKLRTKNQNQAVIIR